MEKAPKRQRTGRRVISRATLCTKISAKCGHADPETVGQVYNGLIKVIMDDLRTYNESYLPDWGMFVLTTTRPHRMKDYQTKQFLVIPATKRLRFRACNQLKYYLKNKL